MSRRVTKQHCLTDITLGVLRKFLRRLPPGRFSDGLLTMLRYRRVFGRFPNFFQPARYSEKIQRRKLFDRKADLVLLQDKYRVRDYVARRIGERYLIPLLQVTDRPADLAFDAFPDQFVVKANHGCGWNVFIRDKETADREAIRGQAEQWLTNNYYRKTREWAYRDIRPLIMVEPFLVDGYGFPHPADIKISCFDGVPRYLVVFFGRSTPDFCAARFLVDGRKLVRQSLHVRKGGGKTTPSTDIDPEIRPADLEEMLEIAGKLSNGIDHLRIDLYRTGSGILFGETAIYPDSGFTRFEPDDFDLVLGSFWTQPY